MNYFEQKIKILLGAFNFVREIEWRIIKKWSDFREDEKVLDAGCGSGIMSMRIAKRGCRVYAVDIDSKMIEKVKSLCKYAKVDCRIFRADLSNLPFKEGVFDKAICNSVLEHIFDDDRVLKEINRVLKPEGTLIITVDSFTYPIGRRLREIHKKISNIFNYYSYSLLVDKLCKSEFGIIKTEYYINSLLSSLFYKIGIKSRFSLWFRFLFPLFYVLALASDKFLGELNRGYGLAIKAKKSRVFLCE